MHGPVNWMTYLGPECRAAIRDFGMSDKNDKPWPSNLLRMLYCRIEHAVNPDEADAWSRAAKNVITAEAIRHNMRRLDEQDRAKNAP
ncbi:hypothetical protein LCGC14_2722640 [marine sediment metagenome]|uniref:Uncharacterized protein n=1 Tax=marine sediment metagenome TaxID=412755 RepID=A0A0F8Z9L5_9ZZZZ